MVTGGWVGGGDGGPERPHRDRDHRPVCEGRHHHLLQDALLSGAEEDGYPQHIQTSSVVQPPHIRAFKLLPQTVEALLLSVSMTTDVNDRDLYAPVNLFCF